MRDILETIAQQIDRLAARPWDIAFPLVGGLAFWQWQGWWGIGGWIVFLLGVAFSVDLTVYLSSGHRQTHAKHGDTSIWIPGFHPFRARSAARALDRDIKEYGEEKMIAALRKGYVVHVTHRKEGGS